MYITTHDEKVHRTDKEGVVFDNINKVVVFTDPKGKINSINFADIHIITSNHPNA